MIFKHRKILIIGCGGAGKSTFARSMSVKLGLNTVHLDKLWWLPNWIERDEKEFDSLLMHELEKSAWIIEGNYLRTFELRLRYAEFTVMLDIPTDECIRSIENRANEYKGKTRPDMTDGCEERIDADFRNYVLSYKATTREKMLDALRRSGKPYAVFDTREKAYDWLNELNI